MAEYILSDDQKKELILLIQKNKSESETYLTSHGYLGEGGEWQEWYNLYHNIPPKKPYKWMSNFFIPSIQPKVNTAVSSLMGMLFSVSPPINVKTKQFSPGDDKHAGIIKNLLAIQLSEKDFFLKFYQFLLGICTYGTFWGKVRWETVYRKVKVKVKQFEPMMNLFGIPLGQKFNGYGEQDTVIEERDKCIFEPLNMYDVFPDPMAIDVDDGWFIHRVRRTKAYLIENMKSESNPGGVYEEVLNIQKEDAINSDTDKNKIQGSMGRNEDNSVSRPEGTELIELLERHGEYDINGDGKLENCVCTLAANKYLIRAEETPLYYIKRPFVKGFYLPLINEVMGLGIPQIACDLQYMKNENINQRNDNLSLIMNAIIRYKKGAGITTSKLRSAPGALFGADDVGDIQFERPSDVTGNNYLHTAEIERNIEEATAVTKMTQGISGPEIGKTATGMSILSRATSDRFMVIAKIIESTIFNKIITMFYQMDYQFMDEVKIGNMVGIDPAEIDMEKMRPDYYEFEPAGIRSIEDRNQKALKLLQFLNIAERFPYVKTEPIIRDIYTLLQVGDNPDKIFFTDEEMANMVMMNQQMAQAQMQQQLQQQMMMGGQPGAPSMGQPGQARTQFSGTQVQTPGVPPVGGANVMPQPELKGG